MQEEEEEAALEAKERVKGKKARRKDRKTAAAAEAAAVAAAPAGSADQQEGGQLTESTPSSVTTPAGGDMERCAEPSDAADSLDSETWAMTGLTNAQRLESQAVRGGTPGGQTRGGQGGTLGFQCQSQHSTEQLEEQGEDAELERLLAGLMVQPEHPPPQLGPTPVAAPSFRDESRGLMTLLAVPSGPLTEAAPRQHPIGPQRTWVVGVEPLLCSLTKVQLIARKI